MGPTNNPYVRRPPLAPLVPLHNVEMGRQSQQRVSNTKRAFALASNNSQPPKKKKGDQLNLHGEVAFDPEKDCIVCKARAFARIVPGARIPKRPHHTLCIKNQKTKGQGIIRQENVVTAAEEKRLKELFAEPLDPQQKASSKYCTKEAGELFFAPRKIGTEMTTNLVQAGTTTTAATTATTTTKKFDFGERVTAMVNDAAYRQKHSAKCAPLAMIAFAEVFVDRVIRPKMRTETMTMVVPPSESAATNPHYHSIVGQKLLYVEWIQRFGVNIQCPNGKCGGALKNDRTNFSKNKTLFPIFVLDGPPSWCIIMKMTCPRCKRQFDSNSPEVLLSLPDYMSNHYPVDPQYALTNHSYHFSLATTNVLESLMLTYGNGEMCSQLLYKAINTSYLNKLTSYLSYQKHHRKSNEVVAPYIEKDGEYLKQYPPHGDTIRDMYNEAATNNNNRWRISDHDRHTRELQSVKCNGGMFAQDHTFEVIKNYRKSLDAKAVWDVATDTGEIAVAVCVPTTMTKHFTHAAKMLQQRPAFNPSATYSDTWPNKSNYWNKLFPNIKGRLGLFHFEKRILRTIRKNHVDFYDAVTDLLKALYQYEASDYEKLLAALKDGTLSPTRKKYTTDEITELKGTKYFRDRYGKYLRKQLRQPNTMAQGLEEWFCKYKVTSSDPGTKPAGGRLDPCRGIALFTSETRAAVQNCKDKAIHLSDPLPLEDMYFAIPPNPNSRHQLTEYLSKRGESKLEAYHDRLANFANSGMRDSLADNLHLAGTAHFNIAIRHKRAFFTRISMEERSKLPASWEKVVPYYNHSQLWHINQLADDVGCKLPFPDAERLPPDNGERFFSEYITTINPMRQQYNDEDECVCPACLIPERNNSNNNNNNNNNNLKPIPPPSVATMPQIVPPKKQICPPIVATTSTPMPTVPTWNPNWNSFFPTPWMPMIQPMPVYFVPQPAPFCCSKYATWSNTRVGRPPHDIGCRNRRWAGKSEIGIEKMINLNNFSM